MKKTVLIGTLVGAGIVLATIAAGIAVHFMDYGACEHYFRAPGGYRNEE